LGRIDILPFPDVLRIEEPHINIYEDDDYNDVNDHNYHFAHDGPDFNLHHPVILAFLQKVHRTLFKHIPASGMRKTIQAKVQLFPSGAWSCPFDRFFIQSLSIGYVLVLVRILSLLSN
jgi:hypothetical protein